MAPSSTGSDDGPCSRKQGLLIYGATGYTGRLLSEEAVRRGLDPILAGRDRARLEAQATSLGVDEVRNFTLEDPDVVERAVSDVACVLHAAGPFAFTAQPMIAACLKARTHYLDITGEMSTFELAESLSERAEEAGIMLLPGVGWDVIPSDTIAFHTAQRVQEPKALRLFLLHAGGLSRGSLASSGHIASAGAKVRRDGRVVTANDAETVTIDFGSGPEVAVPMAMGDVVTAWRSLRVENIKVYMAAPDVDLSVALGGEDLPDGPSAPERAAVRSKVIAEIQGADGGVARSMIETPSTYAFTCSAAIEASSRVLAGGLKPGFQSPVSAYGPELALSIADTRIVDL